MRRIRRPGGELLQAGDAALELLDAPLVGFHRPRGGLARTLDRLEARRPLAARLLGVVLALAESTVAPGELAELAPELLRLGRDRAERVLGLEERAELAPQAARGLDESAQTADV